LRRNEEALPSKQRSGRRKAAEKENDQVIKEYLRKQNDGGLRVQLKKVEEAQDTTG